MDRSDSDSGSDSYSETDANIDTSKYEKKVNFDRKKRDESYSASGTDADIGNSKYERKVDLDTENNVDKEDKKEPFLKVLQKWCCFKDI